jgi:hypothetical protein
MLPKGASREAIVRELDALERLDAGSIAEVARRTGCPRLTCLAWRASTI